MTGVGALAGEALRAFGVEGRLTPLTQTENDVFRVDLANGERMALRVHRPGARARAALEAELSWLAALRAETPLVVPDPVAAPGGDRVVELRAADEPAPRLCALFRWVDGRFLPGDVAPGLFARVGRFVGRLHVHAAAWRPASGLRRGRFDPEAAAARLAPDAPFVRGLPAGARDLVALSLERFRAAFDRLGTGPEVFGLVHADLHQFNVLLHRGQVRAIDFDDCCFGHYLYDLAVTLVGAGPWRTTPAMRAAFLAGYRQERALPAQLEGMLGTFMALRRLLLLRWALGDGPAGGPVVEGILALVRADLTAATDG